MTLKIDLLRPDDLVALTIVPQNLALDTSDAKHPKLKVVDRKKPAYLVVNFPPQSILEEAYFEVATITTSPGFNPAPSSLSGPTTLDPPGSVGARMAGPSRLVFQLPSGTTQIPYTIAGLLDWSKLDLVVSPTAQGKPSSTPISEPTALQTSIELPYRLMMSPAAEAGWAHATEPVYNAGRAELWHTRLATKKTAKKGTVTLVEASDTKTIPLRALWTPDYAPGVPVPGPDQLPFVAPMDKSDRIQIVVLSSWINGLSVVSSTLPAPYVATPVKASRLFLSALGGWLSSRGSWPASPSYEGVSLSLVEWTHLATQGRDHYVRIVYDGFLYPFGHRASLVKVTERKIVPATGTVGTFVAYLRQRMYIVVREPTKTYPASLFRYSGRELPFTSIEIKTKVTPDIADPYTSPLTTSGSFWVEVASGNFQFHVRAVDLAGKAIDFLAPLIFMPQSEQTVSSVVTAYAGSAARACVVPGSKIAYADPSAGDTRLKTSELLFTTELAPNAAQPFAEVPFTPTLDQAVITVPVLEEILGTSTGITISLYPGYLADGMDTFAGVFASVANPEPVSFSAQQSGGLGTPALSMTALSARKGVVAGSPSDAAAGLMDPAAFFDASAQLFGSVPLSSLVLLTNGTKTDATKSAPEIRVKETPNAASPTSVVTIVSWSPALKSSGAVDVNVGGTSALTLESKTTRSLIGGPVTSVVKGELTFFSATIADTVIIKLDGLAFSSSTGSKLKVKADLPATEGVTFQGALGFVQDLANVLPPGIFGVKGPSIDLLSDRVRVTMTIGIPPLTLGVFSLEHIAIMVGVDLPYLSGQPAFEFAFASRGSPFLLLIECLGGGGFIHLVVDPSGVQMVEGALEFGGKFSFDFGVGSGGIHVMAGIYFQYVVATATDPSKTTLTGFVDLGGEVSLLGIISVSIDLNLSLSYISQGGKSTVQGRATLTISVHIIFFSLSVSLSIERSFSSGGGDPKVAQMISAGDWSAYAAAFA